MRGVSPDVESEIGISPDIAHLEEQQFAALEDRIEAALHIGLQPGCSAPAGSQKAP